VGAPYRAQDTSPAGGDQFTAGRAASRFVLTGGLVAKLPARTSRVPVTSVVSDNRVQHNIQCRSARDTRSALPAVPVSAPAVRTLVHPPETNPELPPTCSPALSIEALSAPADSDPPRHDLPTVNFRHSGWQPTRNRVWSALQDANVSDSRLANFELCGFNAWVYESAEEPGRYRVACDRCHDRFCLPCGAERSRVIAANVLERLGKAPARFLTLTLAARDEPLADTVTRLYKCFARLRTRKLWKQSVTGGVAFLEVKRSRDARHWHVHLHALVQGRYLHNHALSATWRKITGDSYVVDIRLVTSHDNATRYVAKYASKPLDPTTTRDPAALSEAIVALTGRRLCLTFGTWRGVSLTDPPDPETWTPIGPLVNILERAAAGDDDARSILATLKGTNLCQHPRPPPTISTGRDAPGQQRFDLIA
jgi:hypothetical protein